MPSTVTDRLAGASASVAVKAPCRVATTANIALSGEQSIDGVAVVAGERVLVKNQSTASQNGIWVAGVTAWSRAKDFDGGRDVVKGTLVPVTDGAVNAGFIFKVTTADPILIGSSSLAFQASTFTDIAVSSFWQGVLDETTPETALATLGAEKAFAKGNDIVSASPLVLGTDGSYFDVTEANAITSITVAAGRFFMLQFDSTPTLTHHATNLNLPGGANITAVAGDRLIGFATATNQVTVLDYIRAAKLPMLQGRHALPVPAAAMYARTSNGAASGSSETPSAKVMLRTFDFDAATDEFVQFQLPMPDSWDEGTVTAKFYWSHGAGANFAVVWGIQGLARGDDDALDTAFGTAVTVTDIGGTADDIYVSAESAALTIAGSLAKGDLVIFQVYRDADDGGDTLTVDARLHAVAIYVNTNEGNDI